MKHWRNSASLVILAKNTVASSQRPYNYDILLQKRISSGSFPDSIVFPGGAVSKSDSSNDWFEYFKSFGFDKNEFNKFQKPNINNLHPITLDGDSAINKHVSLRITAIRETFEELGVLICKQRNSDNSQTPYASYMTDFDIKHWQKMVHNDPTKFYELCKELDCYPDIWSLYLWNNWLTPIKLLQTPRFNTVFFIAGLETRPQTLIEKKEVALTKWMNPAEVLNLHENKEAVILFPQWVEFNKLKHQYDIDKLIHFAAKRSPYGCDLTYPIIQPASDGLVILLPGDECYPADPDLINSHKLLDKVKSRKEMREQFNVLNRIEHEGKNEYYSKNYTPSHFHLSLDSGKIPNISNIPNSSL